MSYVGTDCGRCGTTYVRHGTSHAFKPYVMGAGESAIAADGLAGITAQALLAQTFTPLRWAFAGLLPAGLGVIAAPPKAGKSLLCYQMAVGLNLGADVLDAKAERRPVRYYALEDGPRRAQGRIVDLLAGRSLTETPFDLKWTAPKLGGPLEAEVSEFLDEHPDGVVIIDVLSKVRPSGKAGLNAYDEDYAALTALHGVAKRHPDAVILLVTHDRKAGSDDWMTRVTGTRGITGAADFVIYIDRKRGESAGRVVLTGRDVEDTVIPAKLDGTHWEVATVADVIPTISKVRQTIYEWVEANGPAWQTAIADGTGLSKPRVDARVRDMAKDGQLVGGPNGYVVAKDSGD